MHPLLLAAQQNHFESIAEILLNTKSPLEKNIALKKIQIMNFPIDLMPQPSQNSHRFQSYENPFWPQPPAISNLNCQNIFKPGS